MKQKASRLGMTSVGSGHKRRLMREIVELLSRNMLVKGKTRRVVSTFWAYGPPTVKPIVCQRVIRAVESVGAVRLTGSRAI